MLFNGVETSSTNMAINKFHKPKTGIFKKVLNISLLEITLR